MTATWVVIGVLGAFAAAVLTMVFQILGKVDSLRTDLTGEIRRVEDRLGGRIDKLEETTGRIDTRLGQTNDRIDALYRHLAVPEGHPS